MRIIQKGRFEPEAREYGADLYTHEVLVEVFGFSPVRLSPLDISRGQLRGPRGQFFSKSGEGPVRYRAATASVSRMFRRLEERHLVTRIHGASTLWSGVDLTEKGEKVANRVYWVYWNAKKQKF